MLLPPGSAVLNGGSNETQSFWTTIVAEPPRFGAPAAAWAGLVSAGLAAVAGFEASAGFAASAGLLSAGFGAAGAGAHASSNGRLATVTAPSPSTLSSCRRFTVSLPRRTPAGRPCPRIISAVLVLVLVLFLVYDSQGPSASQGDSRTFALGEVRRERSADDARRRTRGRCAGLGRAAGADEPTRRLAGPPSADPGCRAPAGLPAPDRSRTADPAPPSGTGHRGPGRPDLHRLLLRRDPGRHPDRGEATRPLGLAAHVRPRGREHRGRREGGLSGGRRPDRRQRRRHDRRADRPPRGDGAADRPGGQLHHRP